MGGGRDPAAVAEVRTPDLGGTSSTMEVGEAIAAAVSHWEHGAS